MSNPADNQYGVEREVFDMDTALALQRKIILFHMKNLVFKKVIKAGVEGIELNSSAAVDGLCLHMSYFVQITSLILLGDVNPFIMDLSNMVNSGTDELIIVDFLQKNLPVFIQFVQNNAKFATDNVVYLTEELARLGWTDSML